MRKKDNIKKLGHGGKSASERSAYQSMLEKGEDELGTTDDVLGSEADFQETTEVEGKIAEGDPIPSKSRKTYRSYKTQIKDHWVGVVLTAFAAIIVSSLGWNFLETIKIGVQEERINLLEEDIEETQEDLSIVRDRSLQSETLIKVIEKYVDRLIGIED